MATFFRNTLKILIAPLLLLTAWQLLALKLHNPVVLPTVSEVLLILITPSDELLGMGSLFENIAVSLWRVLIGYALAAIFGVPLGILMGYSKTFFQLFQCLIGIIRPIPPLAWVPLVLAWFGVLSLANILALNSGEAYLYLRNIKISMVFIIFIGAFHPIVANTIHGVKSVRLILVDSALVLGAGTYDIFRKILLPAAAPSIVSGMRIGLSVAWMCLVAAEMLPGSIAGVGYLITHAYTVARTDIVIAGMISIGLIGALLDTCFGLITDSRFAWQRLSR